jgi:hypothetical protein
VKLTPQQIYALPDLSVTYWYDGHNAMVEKALQFVGWGHGEQYILDNDTDRLAVYEKLRVGPAGAPDLRVFALSFDGHSFRDHFFAVVIIRQDDIESQEIVVTNASFWQMAREHVMVVVNKNVGFVGGLTKKDAAIAIPELVVGDGESSIAGEHVSGPDFDPNYSEKL